MPELKVCNKCGELHTDISSSRCRNCHQPKQRSRKRIEADKFYSTSAWRHVRQQALHRDHYQCTACQRRNTLIVHHYISIQDGCDPLDIDNLMTLCRSCHARLHARERAAQ